MRLPLGGTAFISVNDNDKRPHVVSVARELLTLGFRIIATGGTAEAAAALIQEMGGEVVECGFIIDLPEIGGRARLENEGLKVFALCEFEGA